MLGHTRLLVYTLVTRLVTYLHVYTFSNISTRLHLGLSLTNNYKRRILKEEDIRGLRWREHRKRRKMG